MAHKNKKVKTKKGRAVSQTSLVNHGEGLPVLVINRRVASSIALFSALSSDLFPYKRISFKNEVLGFKFNLEMIGFTVTIKLSL